MQDVLSPQHSLLYYKEIIEYWVKRTVMCHSLKTALNTGPAASRQMQQTTWTMLRLWIFTYTHTMNVV